MEIEGIRYRASTDAVTLDDRTLRGRAITYGDVASLPGGLRERFRAGAFGGDVAGLDVILNRQHQRALPLARTNGGGLVLIDSAEGLDIEATLPETAAANETLELVRSSILRGLSIEFAIRDFRMIAGTREVTAALLAGIGVVDKPAYPESRLRDDSRRKGGLWLG